jgi:uncharacterized membrane protein
MFRTPLALILLQRSWAFVLLLSWYLVMPSVALADIQFCNDAPVPIATAVMTYPPNYSSTDFLRTVKGWYVLQPKECRVVYVGPVTGEGYYAHAQSMDGKWEWKGDEGVFAQCIIRVGPNDPFPTQNEIDKANQCAAVQGKKSGMQNRVCVSSSAFEYQECRPGGADVQYQLQCPSPDHPQAIHPAPGQRPMPECNIGFFGVWFGLAARNDNNPEVSNYLTRGGFFSSVGGQRSTQIDFQGVTHRYLFKYNPF